MVVLVIERGPGVETKPIKTSYSAAAGTAFVTFENVHVPYENTLGNDNGGLQVILSNFNHERYGLLHIFRSCCPLSEFLSVGAWLVGVLEPKDILSRNASSQSAVHDTQLFITNYLPKMGHAEASVWKTSELAGCGSGQTR